MTNLELRAAAERYRGDEDSLHKFVFDGRCIQNADGYIVARVDHGMEEDCRAMLKLADFGDSILAGMPEGKDLPAGPWTADTYIGDPVIRCGDGGNIIATLNEIGAFTPKEVTAIASLLIWARRVVGEGE